MSNSLNDIFKQVYKDGLLEFFPTKPDNKYYGPSTGWALQLSTLFKPVQRLDDFYLINNKWLNNEEYKKIAFKSNISELLDG